MAKGVGEDMARAMVLNPMMLQTLLPTIFSPRTQVVNNRLIRMEPNGSVTELANLSDKFMPLQPGAGVLNTATGEMRSGGRPPLTADDRRAVRTAEDNITNARATRDALSRALELNRHAYTGVLARARGWAGTSLPGGDWLPGVERDPAMATREMDQILSLESIKQMSDTLKGATTDRELFEFQRILSDPTTPTDIRARTIRRMIQLADARIADEQARSTEIRGGTYYQPGGGQSRGRGALPRVASDADYSALPSGARFIDPEGRERVKP